MTKIRNRSFRFSEEEMRDMDYLSKEMELNLTEVIRVLVRNEVNRRGRR
jgi:Na+/phosphate symporter